MMVVVMRRRAPAVRRIATPAAAAAEGSIPLPSHVAMEDPHKVRREIPDRGTGAAGNLLHGGHGVPLRELLELRHDFLVEVDLGAEARVEQLGLDEALDGRGHLPHGGAAVAGSGGALLDGKVAPQHSRKVADVVPDGLLLLDGLVVLLEGGVHLIHRELVGFL